MGLPCSVSLIFLVFASWRGWLLLLPHWHSQVCFKEQQLEITFCLFSKKSHIRGPCYFVRTVNFRQSEKWIQRWHRNPFAGKQNPPSQSTGRFGLSGGSRFWYRSYVIDLLPGAKPLSRGQCSFFLSWEKGPHQAGGVHILRVILSSHQFKLLA